MNISTSLLLPQEAIAPGTTRSCRLLAGPVAISAQFVLLIVVLSALSIKRHRERPRRSMIVWLLDLSKQGASAGAGHVVGMLVAIIAHSQSGQASECGWYFVVYFMDASLGITLAITFHKLTSGLARWCSMRAAVQREFGEESSWWEALVDSGNYGDAATPDYRKWAIQVLAWASCVVSARCCVGLTVVTFLAPLSYITDFMDAKFVGHPDTYLYTVMVGIPLVMNVGQAWIQDQVLKWSSKKHSREKQEDDDRRGSDDEEGGHGSGRKAVDISDVGKLVGSHAHSHVPPAPSFAQLSKPSERVAPHLVGGGLAAAAAGKGDRTTAGRGSEA